ncbi:MAG: glycosyltransferase family 2 protein [Chitinophagaceae bacterium]|nr:MAG: glycosyltransferase family 2 protein [Chitinophagaceae bacterium]
MRLSVIIVNYNVKYFLEQCLCSVQKACTGINAEVWVVDNASADGSEAYFKDRFPAVQFIWNKENQGFAKANNLALAKATGDFILFLNPDTLLPEDCFKKCIGFLDSKNCNGALGIRMVDGAGNFLKESKRGFPTAMTAFYKLSGLASLFPRSTVFAKYYLGNLSEKENHEVDVLAGAFMMVPRKVLEQTGGFDERFFMYGEDVDLSYRIQQAGYKNYYFSESSILHFKGESSNKHSLKQLIVFYKAMLLFVKKYQRGLGDKLFGLFLQVAIYLRIIVAVILLPFQFLNKRNGYYEPLLLIGAQIETAALLSQLYDNNNKTAVQANMHQLVDQLIKYPKAEIVFCEGVLSFREIINSIQAIPKGARFRFHAEGTGSVVGSESKDQKGVHWVLTPTKQGY